MSDWEITNEGRRWRSDEAMDRFFMVQWKYEMVDGRLFDTPEQREIFLGLLLENIGADRAVTFGDPAVWKAAIDKLPIQ